MTAITSAIWTSPPKAGKAIKPSSHKTSRIIPIINRITPPTIAVNPPAHLKYLVINTPFLYSPFKESNLLRTNLKY